MEWSLITRDFHLELLALRRWLGLKDTVVGGQITNCEDHCLIIQENTEMVALLHQFVKYVVSNIGAGPLSNLILSPNMPVMCKCKIVLAFTCVEKTLKQRFTCVSKVSLSLY